MAEEHTLIDDILRSEKGRMLYLKKYYPFFVLSEISLAQYQEGKYRDLDMGYITMALLRFFIEENHFNGRKVLYPAVEKFLTKLIERDFATELNRSVLVSGEIADEEQLPDSALDVDPFGGHGRRKPGKYTEYAGLNTGKTSDDNDYYFSWKSDENRNQNRNQNWNQSINQDSNRNLDHNSNRNPNPKPNHNQTQKDLIRFIFDKIRNDGKPFIFPFYDPETHTRQQGFVRLIDSTVQDGEVVYEITADAIEFYLATKEVRDESNISTEQILLEKMIRTENFRGGIDVIRRINLDVEMLKKERREVVRLLQEDLTLGLARSEAFMDRIHKWFDLERKSFQKNKALVDKAVARFSAGQGSKDIYVMETELKKVIESHRMLMEEAADLSRLTSELVERAKLRSLRPAFDFRRTLDRLKEEDMPGAMGMVLSPFFLPRRRKSLSIFSIDKLVSEAVPAEEEKEKKEKLKVDLSFEYEDEKLSRMIGQNFAFLFKELLERVERWGTFSLGEYNAILEAKFGKEVYRNRDFFSFLAHLAKKERYVMTEAFTEPETFLEAYANRYFTPEEKERFKEISFSLEFGDEEVELPLEFPKEGDSVSDEAAAEGLSTNLAGTVKMIRFSRTDN